VIVLIADYQVMTDQHAGNQLPGTVRGVVADYLPPELIPAGRRSSRTAPCPPSTSWCCPS
jgi:hypothetical protein